MDFKHLGVSVADYVGTSNRTVLAKMGDRGDVVKQVQTLLTQRGYKPGPIDGVFGSQTQAAVIAFQMVAGLNADGAVDQRTFDLLNSKQSVGTGAPAEQKLPPSAAETPWWKVALAVGAGAAAIAIIMGALKKSGSVSGVGYTRALNMAPRRERQCKGTPPGIEDAELVEL